MDPLELLRQFKSRFDEYRAVCQLRQNQVRALGHSSSPADYERESALRRELGSRLGVLQPYLDAIPHVGWWWTNITTKVNYHLLDNALDQIGAQQPTVLHHATQALDKAEGALTAFTPGQRAALPGGPPTLFLSYSFRPENERLVGDLRDLASSYGFRLVEGEAPSPASVSDKVKALISTSEACLAVLTHDRDVDNVPSASEWVVQEAAFALGQGKSVVRFVQEGVDAAGRIFGDAEYVAFDRADSARGLVRLGRMLSAVARRLRTRS
jgi:hypothetical protein